VIKRAHLAPAFLYFIVAYVILFCYGDRRYFCSQERTGHNYAHTTAVLAAACTVWSAFASALGTLPTRTKTKRKTQGLLAIATAAVVGGVGFASIPFWLYRGYGTFLLEHTWFDVSCFFTEGFGLIFPFVVAPLLTATTVLQEWLILRTNTRALR
jgi:hypothetical protein